MIDMSVYLLPHFEKFIVLRRYGFFTSPSCNMNLRSSLIALCSIIFPSLPMVWTCTCFIRDFISCWRNKEKTSCMCTCYNSDKYNLIILRNNLLFFIMKIRKSTSQILDCIYEFFRPSKLGPVRIFTFCDSLLR